MSKILVIDDEKPTLAMSRLVLGAYGYDVLTAEDGEDGLAVFQAERPPLVLTDIKMPGMDGLTVLERIKEIDPTTEVIVITGHGDMDLALRALNLGATDFINKPIGKDALESALSRASERLKSSRGENEIIQRQSGPTAIMEIRGNVTSNSEPYLLAAYEKIADQPQLLMLFDPNSTINGAGIAVLTQIVMAGAKRHQTIGMAGLPDNFVKVFDLVGITRFARIYPDETKALARMNRHVSRP